MKIKKKVIFRKVPGLPGVSASKEGCICIESYVAADGRIRKKRVTRGWNRGSERVFYLKGSYHGVAKAVSSAWNKSRVGAGDQVVEFIDGDTSNCCLSNLRLSKRLTPQNLRDLSKWYAEGVTWEQIGDRLGTRGTAFECGSDKRKKF